MPEVWPGGMMQTLPLPGQQSDVAVHAPLVGTHEVVLQTKWPVLSGRQTLPLQQSADVAQAPLDATHVVTVEQRGTPTLSSRQAILLAPVAPQQSELIELTEQPLGSGVPPLSTQMPVAGSYCVQWQTSPSGMQALLLQPGSLALVHTAGLGQLVPLGMPQVPRPRAVSKMLQTTSPAPWRVHAV
jgi:hypothetical protein